MILSTHPALFSDYRIKLKSTRPVC